MKFQILKMEKHPIDELFAKKMAEYRQEPSQRAFERFQARVAEREQQKRGGGFLSISHNRRWYYAAAAGMAIALSVVFLSQKDSSKGDFAQNKPKKEVIQPKNTVEPIIQKETLATTNSSEIQKQEVVKPLIQNNIIEKSIENLVTVNQNSIAQNTEPKVIQNNQNSIIDHTEANDIAITNSVVLPTETIDNQSVTNQIESNKNEAVIAQNPVEKVESGTFIADNSVKTPKDEVITAIDADSVTEFEKLRQAAMEREEYSKSFLARLSEEYRHLKYGEKVDLENLKVKPKDVLARADERILRDERNDIKETFYRKVGKFLKN